MTTLGEVASARPIPTESESGSPSILTHPASPGGVTCVLSSLHPLYKPLLDAALHPDNTSNTAVKERALQLLQRIAGMTAALRRCSPPAPTPPPVVTAGGRKDKTAAGKAGGSGQTNAFKPLGGLGGSFRQSMILALYGETDSILKQAQR